MSARKPLSRYGRVLLRYAQDRLRADAEAWARETARPRPKLPRGTELGGRYYVIESEDAWGRPIMRVERRGRES